MGMGWCGGIIVAVVLFVSVWLLLLLDHKTTSTGGGGTDAMLLGASAWWGCWKALLKECGGYGCLQCEEDAYKIKGVPNHYCYIYMVS